jgi:group I intron endonuclease
VIGYVYITTNDINDTIYIGKRQKPEFDKHYKGSGKHLKCAIRKYGSNHFHSEIIERCETVDELLKCEAKWVEHYRKLNYPMYNIAEGGRGGRLRLWQREDPEKKAAADEKNRQAHLGSKNPFYGRKHTLESRIAISRAQGGKGMIDETKNKIKRTKRGHLKRVEQLDRKTGEVIKVWDNWCAAGEHFGKTRYSYAHISECCNGTKKSAYGYKWRLAESGVSV